MIKLKELRKKFGINQIDMCKVLHCSQSNYSKYEREEIKLNTDDIIKICSKFNVTADYLLGITTHEIKSDVQENIINKLSLLSEIQSQKVDAYITALLDETEQAQKRK